MARKSTRKRPAPTEDANTSSSGPPMKRRARNIPTIPVVGGWDNLPHGLGQVSDVQRPATRPVSEPEGDLVAPPKIVIAVSKGNDMPVVGSQDVVHAHGDEPKNAIPANESPSAVEAPERRRSARLKERATVRDSEKAGNSPNRKIKEAVATAKGKFDRLPHGEPMVNDGSLQDDPDGDKGADGVKAKSDIYTRAERRTRLLEWTFPAASAYHEVHDILTKLHGEVTQPEVMPGPSLQVAGCGEVPSVLDALLRTLLSGATSMENANRAVQGLAARFPLAMSGSGQGSIDWDTVRRSSIAKLTTAIRSGGLSNIKAKYIKQILDKVYADNIGKKEPLSLDFMHQMSGKEALLELAKLPGVGVKTAACVVLFCLKKPMFAVDTHVHRLCRWLGWVPPKSTADDTFFHLNTRIPQELHYGLHQLFIRHGKVCGRCSARSTEGGPIWEQVVCPLEHLLVRFDKRKTQITAKTAKGVEESDDEYRLAPEKSKASNSNAKEILAPKAGKKSTQPGATDTLATEATKKRGHSNAKDNSSRARKTSNDANAEDGPKPSKKSTTRVGRTKHAVSGGKAANDTNTVTGGQVTAVGVAEAPPTNAAVSGLGRRPWTRSMAKQLMDG